MLYETSLVTTVTKVTSRNNQAVSSKSGVHTAVMTKMI